MSSLARCPGCGFAAPTEDGPVHPYMTSSPACWRHFNALMAREYETPELMPTHYLGVDAFAAQHPGDPDELRARQSVWIHLAGLHAVLREGRKPSYRYELLRRLAHSRSDWPAAPDHGEFPVVAAKIPFDQPVVSHVASMRNWAETTLSAYEQVDPNLPDRLAALA